MKRDSAYENAFGAAPDSFKRRVDMALLDIQEEKEMKRNSVRVVLITALVLIALMGIAYATVTRLGMVDFFAQYIGEEVSEETLKAITFEEPLATADLGEMTFEVTGAVADGRYVYVTSLFTPKTDDMIIMNNGEEIKDYPPERLDGKRLFFTGTEVYVASMRTNTYNHIGKEGLVASMNSLEYKTDADELKIMVVAWTVEIDTAFPDAEGPGEYIPGTQVKQVLNFTIPVTRAVETRTLREPLYFPKIGVTLDSLTLIRTPITTYYDATYIFDADSRFSEEKRFSLLIVFSGEDDIFIQSGPAWHYEAKRTQKNRYTTSGSLSLTPLPDTLTVTLASYMYQQAVTLHGSATATLDIVE